MPCTGGSPWQNLDRTKPGGEEKLMKHRQLFQGIWSAFTKVAKVCDAHGGKIAIEWPSGCAYWKWAPITNFINKYQLNLVKVTGRALGLKTEKGVPMIKPWTLATNGPYVLHAFRGWLSPGQHEHPVHQKVGSVN
eukprot:608461-Heterocapsa_arctica.AAC.1